VLWQAACSLLGSSDFYAGLWQQRDALRELDSLLVWGGMHDTSFTPQYLSRWQRTLPKAQALHVGNAGHWPHEEQPQIAAGVVRCFFDTHGKG